MLEKLINQLSKDFGGEPIPANEDGSFTLLLDEELEISLRENAESGITVYASLAPFPSADGEDFLVHCMSANLLGHETGRGALGLNREGNTVVFHCFLPPDLTYSAFRDGVEEFANYADAWRADILQFAHEVEE